MLLLPSTLLYAPHTQTLHGRVDTLNAMAVVLLDSLRTIEQLAVQGVQLFFLPSRRLLKDDDEKNRDAGPRL